MIRNVEGDRKLTDLCLSEKTLLPYEDHAIGFPGWTQGFVTTSVMIKLMRWWSLFVFFGCQQLKYLFCSELGGFNSFYSAFTQNPSV